VLAGLFFAMAPLPDPGADLSLHKTPRFKSFLAALFTPMALLAADWKKLGVNLDLTEVCVGYYIAFVISALVCLTGFAAGIYVVRQRAMGSWPRNFGGESPLDRVILFVVYGVARLRRAVDAENRKLAEARSSAFGLAHLERIGTANAALTKLMHGVAGWQLRRDAASREELVDRILEAIEGVARAYARAPESLRELRANYMDVVPIPKVKRAERDAVRFIWPREETWSHLLVLRRYGGRIGTQAFALPVGRATPPDAVMLGAPEAFETGRATYTDKRNLKFGNRIPKEIRSTVRNYLGPQPFRTFVSIPIDHPNGTVGILNIESTEIYILGEDEDVMNSVIKCLYPYCALLGQLLAAPSEAKP
jgi:hypothetical protein